MNKVMRSGDLWGKPLNGLFAKIEDVKSRLRTSAECQPALSLCPGRMLKSTIPGVEKVVYYLQLLGQKGGNDRSGHSMALVEENSVLQKSRNAIRHYNKPFNIYGLFFDRRYTTL